MASLIKSTYFSKILGRDVTSHVLLPENRKEEKLKTLYLLHGALENGDIIIENSDVLDLADIYHLAVVIPSLGNGFYVDKCHEFLVNELMPYVRLEFLLSPNREDTYIAGISMGGFGAFYNGLKRSDLFSKVISISGALDISFGVAFIKMCGEEIPVWLKESKQVLHEKYGINSLIKKNLNQLYYLSCGKDDLLTFVNEKFIEELQKREIPFVYIEKEGNHDWSFWKNEISAVFKWIYSN